MRRLLAAVACAGLFACATPGQEPRTPERHTGPSAPWVLKAARIYVSPDAPPIDDGVVLVEGEKIVAVAPAANMRMRAGMQVSECSGGVITAGFQNSHVHFMGTSGQSTAELSNHLEHMLNRYGFTTVVDTASDVEDTAVLRKRIDRGEVRGPRLLTAGWGLYPPDGVPFYLRDLPPPILERLPQPATPEEAIQVVRRNFAAGADATKLFVVTPQTDGSVRRMPAEIIRAAVKETHARGALVLVHPTSNEGVRMAIAGGADVLVHTVLGNEKTSWEPSLVRELIEHGVSVVPTLKLWTYELAKTKLPENIRALAVGDAIEQLRAFASAGGQVLFGTDVGYMSEFDPTDEYVLMSRAGLTPMQILASLTTAPAVRWKESSRRGRVVAGLDADLVVLDADPASDVKNFATVRCAFRAGQETFAQRAGGS
jgi:imidazolonepropionase-like amidohydrolase